MMEGNQGRREAGQIDETLGELVCNVYAFGAFGSMMEIYGDG